MNSQKLSENLIKRIQITTSCKDSEFIAKVPNAGKIVKENDTYVQIMFNGLKVLAGGYYGEWMAQIIQSLKGHHEPQEEKVYFELLKK